MFGTRQRQQWASRLKRVLKQRLACEWLEDRRLLAVITVDTLTDEADGSIVDGDISLRDAIAVAAAGDTIDFDASLDGGTILLTMGELDITKSISVDASSLLNGLTIDASGNDPTPDEDNGDGSRIFAIDDGDLETNSEVTLYGLTLTGGDVDGDGGAVRTRECIEVTNSTITGNAAIGGGGGILVIPSPGLCYGLCSLYDVVTINSSTITGNSAGDDGGGIAALEPAGIMRINSSIITGNSAGRAGGGIFGPRYVPTRVTSSIVSGNTASIGGGIYTSDYSVLSVASSVISGNSASLRGGGISGGSYAGVQVNSSVISGNSAAVGGGISGSWRGHVSVTSSTITGNSGGGIRAAYASVTSSTISGNSTSRSGGGIAGDDHVSVMSSTISGNSADEHGGGIAGGRYGVSVTSSTISDNSASGKGGGIYSNKGWVTISSSTITGNLADSGGGSHVLGGYEFEITNSIVAANSDNGTRPDVAATVILTATSSLIGDNTGSGLSEAPIGMPDENGNLVGDPNGNGIINPLLSPLGNFGGGTLTQALLPDSPAINMGDPDFLAPPDHDQRGTPFERVSGGRIDMGAFEYQIAPVDFNDDTQLDCDDVDSLVAAIVADNNPSRFDLTGDELVNQWDLEVWPAIAGLENLPSHEAYLLGDTNLDGKVDDVDLNIVGANWIQNVSGWCSGDVTADGVVNASDLNKVGLNWLRDATGEATVLSNGDFEGGVYYDDDHGKTLPNDWQYLQAGPFGGPMVGTATSEVVEDTELESNVLEVRRTGAGASGALHGLRQFPDLDVSNASSVEVSLDVKVIHQSLSGDGCCGTEFPASIQVFYQDSSANTHSFRHAFYYAGIADSNPQFPITKINQNQWYAFPPPSTTVDLMELNPPPEKITDIWLFGNGWNYTARFDNVQLMIDDRMVNVTIVGQNDAPTANNDMVAEAAANQHLTRAPLPNRMVVAIVDASEDPVVLDVASRPTFSPTDTTEYISPSHFTKRYVLRGLTSSSPRVSSATHDVQQSPEIEQEHIVDVVLGRW